MFNIISDLGVFVHEAAHGLDMHGAFGDRGASGWLSGTYFTLAWVMTVRVCEETGGCDFGLMDVTEMAELI